MNQNEIEDELREFGQAWSRDDSFANSVISRIEAQAGVETVDRIAVSSPLGRLWWNRSVVAATLAVVVGLAVAFGVWSGRSADSFVSAEMLTKAFRAAIESVDTVRMSTTSYDDSGKKLGGDGNGILCLFDRKLGFVRGVMDGGDWKIVDLDNGVYRWGCDFEKELVSRRASTKAFASFFEQGVLSESDYERLEDEDKKVDGRSLACYSIKNLAPFSDGKQRVFVYVDSNNLVHFSRTWKFKNERWNLIREVSYWYNVEIDASKFEPKFDRKFRIVDIDAEVEALASLDDCLYSRNVSGLIYAIHRATPLKCGGLAVFASLRVASQGSPPHFSSWRLYNSSPQFGHFYRIVNAEAMDRIRMQWFLLVPRESKWHQYDLNSKLVEINALDSIVKGEKVTFEDTLSLNGPEPDRDFQFKNVSVNFEFDELQEPVSLEEAAAMIYQEQKMLANVPFKLLHTGVEAVNGTPTEQRGTVESKTETEFQQAVVDHLAYWQGIDADADRKAMERQITSGFVTVRKPAVHVSGVKEFADEHLQRACQRDLVVVDVSSTSVSDNGIEMLTGMNSLEELTLCKTAITDKSIEVLIQLKALRKLNITDTMISKEGFERLKAELTGVEIEY